MTDKIAVLQLFLTKMKFVMQVECIMAILIHRNFIKGYFSHKSKVVVLSKQDAFPVLSARPLTS
jgi:hypothetical protein